MFIVTNVTREFNNVVEGYKVEYDDSSTEYKVTRIINKDEYCWLNTQDKNVVQNLFDVLNRIYNF